MRIDYQSGMPVPPGVRLLANIGFIDAANRILDDSGRPKAQQRGYLRSLFNLGQPQISTDVEPRLPILAFLSRHGFENAVRHIETGLDTRPEIRLILTHPKISATLGFVIGCALELALNPQPSGFGRVSLEIGMGIGGALGVAYGIPVAGLFFAYVDSVLNLPRPYEKRKNAQEKQP